MTSEQFISLWQMAQEVPRDLIDFAGRGKARQVVRKELYPGVYGEIWIGQGGRYFYCEVRV